MKKPLACIINISTNNILSIQRALEYIGFETIVINEYKNIENFDLIVLPGVGAYHEAIKTLKDTKLLNSVEQALEKKKNFLAICLGLQLLFEESEEFGTTKGISFFKGRVENFNKYKAEKDTFIGWNKINFNTNKKLFINKTIEKNFIEKEFYFVHSYFAKTLDKDLEVGFSSNGNVTFSSIIKKDNVIACQFHPEKSGKNGIEFLKKIYKNFV
jgi:imidazole glycerol-phosphate synthase subunit HisH